jgi:histidine ammonia-lyase
MSPIAARKLASIVENLALVLAIELVVAFQAMEFLRPLASSRPIESLRRSFRKLVAPWNADRELAPDLAAARAFLEGDTMSRLVATLA